MCTERKKNALAVKQRTLIEGQIVLLLVSFTSYFGLC